MLTTCGNIKLPSNRRFGLFFFIICLVLALVFHWDGKGLLSLIFGLSAFAFMITAVFFSTLLRPLNISWMFLGLVLGKIFNPIILGIIYFFLITPIALVCRAFGRDELFLKKITKKSCWIKVDKTTPVSNHYHNQF